MPIDPLDPSSVEILRRSVAMLGTGQKLNLDRDRALALLGRLQDLETQHREVIGQLRAVLAELEEGPLAR